jgi:hypothetical protein
MRTRQLALAIATVLGIAAACGDDSSGGDAEVAADADADGISDTVADEGSEADADAPPTAPPTITTFLADPATVHAGEPTMLRWAVTDATSLSIDQGVGPVTGTSTSVTPMATTTYTLTAANTLGSVDATTTVTVTAEDTYSLPPERSTTWQPGVTYNGGIPDRTTVCATLSPLGGGASDTEQIQAALDTCPDDQVVQLAAGTFQIGADVNGGIFIERSHVTLRGTVDADGEPATTLVCQTDGGCGSIIVLGTLWVHP